MGDFQEEKNVSVQRPLTAKEAKAQAKALMKLDNDTNDVRRMSVWAIIWHLIMRGKKLWFYCGLVAFGYVLGFFYG